MTFFKTRRRVSCEFYLFRAGFKNWGQIGWFDLIVFVQKLLFNFLMKTKKASWDDLQKNDCLQRFRFLLPSRGVLGCFFFTQYVLVSVMTSTDFNLQTSVDSGPKLL